MGRPMSDVTAEQARHFTRVVELTEAAYGAELSATAGQSPRRLTSLPMLEAFLKPFDEVTYENLHDTVNYVNPVGLAEWVRDTIGDAELGEALAEIADDGRAFGFQVRDIKPLIRERLLQYAEALGLPQPVEPVAAS